MLKMPLASLVMLFFCPEKPKIARNSLCYQLLDPLTSELGCRRDDQINDMGSGLSGIWLFCLAR